MEKTIYNLKLHERLDFPKEGFAVMRVPGGWIYTRQEPQANIANPVFVPYVRKGFVLKRSANTDGTTRYPL